MISVMAVFSCFVWNLWTPNARLEPLPEAGAERTLKAVGSRRSLGWGHSGGLPGGYPPPRDAVPLVVLLEATATLLKALHQPT
jgi:hypothetical protein